MVFIAFLCYSGHFTFQSVLKAPFLLDVFICAPFYLLHNSCELLYAFCEQHLVKFIVYPSQPPFILLSVTRDRQKSQPRTQARKEEEKGLVPIARTCVNYPKKTWGAANDCTHFRPPSAPRVRCDVISVQPHTLGCGKRVKKHTVVCGTPSFLKIVGACACSRQQALSPPPQRAWIRGQQKSLVRSASCMPKSSGGWLSCETSHTIELFIMQGYLVFKEASWI